MAVTKAVKVLVLGETGVGKTSLIRSILNEPLTPSYEPTQDDWYTGVISTTDDKSRKVQFLDTGGYDTFPELIKCYMKTALAFIVVVRHNCVKSTICAERIVKDIKSCRGEVPIICASTQCDADLISPTCVLNGCGAAQSIMCSSYLNIGISEIKLFLSQALSSQSPPTSPKTNNFWNTSSNLRAIFQLKVAKKETTPIKAPKIKVRPPLVRKSSSHPDLRSPDKDKRSSLSNWPSSAGSAGRLNKLISSHTTAEQLNDIYKKYGYEKKTTPGLSPPVFQSSSVGNIASSIRSSTTCIVKSVQDTIGKLSS